MTFELGSPHDLLGWAALAVSMLGNGLLVRRRTSGWAAKFAGGILWVIWSAGVGMVSGIVNDLLFLGMFAWGWLEWRKHDRAPVDRC